MKWLLHVLSVIRDCLDPVGAARRESHERRSAGAKRGWAKRKAKPEVPNDIQ